MTFGDLKNMEGQIIDYYVVKGYTVKHKRGKINKSDFYYGVLSLYAVDKKGRCYSYPMYYIHYNDRWDNRNKNVEQSIVYYNHSDVLFLDKEVAYNHIIGKLRQRQREINKKMMAVQLELYGKKVE